MNRRAITIGTGALALGGLGLGYWLYPKGNLAGPATTGQNDNYVRPHSPIIGKAGARVTVVEFFDPACEACRAFHPILGQILGRHPEDVRVVLRYAPFHQGSDEAVRILETARLQDRFEQVLDALFVRQPEWASHGAPSLDAAWRIAGAAGLDLGRARGDARRPEIDQVLRTDTADLQSLQIKQTPTFFVNTRPLLSFGPRQLYELILSELNPPR
jgi:protein-disulfide isomerase